MQNIVWKVILIIAIIAFCLWASYPPEEKIRLGKDLRGGTSLIYLVSIPEGTGDKAAIMAQTIDVLQDRVNPNGVLDISMQPMGADRLEIVMPLPNEQVKELRQQYETAMHDLVKLAHIRPNDLDEALRFNTAVERFGGAGETEQSKKIAALQDAFNKLQSSQQALKDAQEAGAEAAQVDPIEQSVADAQFEYEQLRDSIRKSSMDQSRVIRTLGLPHNRQGKLDASGVLEASARDTALTNLKSEFPHLSNQIDAVVAAYDAYQDKRTTLDDPEDLQRMLRGAGVLEFHIAARASDAQGLNVDEMRAQLNEVGPGKTDSAVARWFAVNEIKQWYKTPEQLASLEADAGSYFATNYDLVGAAHEGRFYLLLYTTKGKSITHDSDVQWTVVSTGITQDELGRPAVSFRLDASGGNLMSRLTGPHVGQPMAIVLDGQVYSAPRLNSAISNSGVIQGDFTVAEREYLTRVLAAGALGARLSDQPIAVNTLGPSLGKDNLVRGLEACMLSLIVTAVIMLGYYFFAGVIANIALVCNAIFIFGVMALMSGTFTLPGLAGVALSIAMAVDANVLIYERIREEIVNNKEDLRTAIRLGFQRAMSAIVDGNLTNLIVCIVLMKTATTEVKGFAMTMMIGVGSTLFAALFITRTLYFIYTDVLKFKTLPMLPTVFPGVNDALTPSLNWISKRGAFFTLSAILSIGSLVLVYMRGGEMLDMEFRGGLSMSMQTRVAQPGDEAGPDGRLLLERFEVERQIRSIGDSPGLDSNSPLFHLRTASVLTLGQPTADFKSSSFRIKVTSPPDAEDAAVTDEVVDAVANKFGDQLDVTPSLSFKGRHDPNHTPYTHVISSPKLGANINLPQQEQSVEDFVGGVVTVVEDLNPAVTPEEAKDRINRLREQPDFAFTRGRDSDVIGLQPVDPNDPAKGYTSIAVLTFDPNFNHQKVDFEVWDRQLAAAEWKLISAALERRTTLQEISSFSPAMAHTLAASAVVAIILSLVGMVAYIWVRFGSIRFSLSAIVGLVHNVVICVGALALTHYLAGTRFASMLMLEEYRIDLNVIAALLTIIGYSLNDTIVILDRIRENRGRRPALTADIVNKSINQTFSRTILTGGSTILASIILFVLGGPALQPFAFTFFIGLVVGTYSSVAISAPLVIQSPDDHQPEVLPLEVHQIKGTTGLVAR